MLHAARTCACKKLRLFPSASGFAMVLAALGASPSAASPSAAASSWKLLSKSRLRLVGLAVRIAGAAAREAGKASRERLEHHGAAVTVSPTQADKAKLRVWQQGSEAMYTAVAVAQRTRNRASGGVTQELDRWWQVAVQSEGSDTGKLSFDTYHEMYMRIHCSLLEPGESWDEPEADELVREAWRLDTKGRGDHISRVEFCNALFELCDMWTDTAEEAEYVDFLRTMLSKLTDSDGQWKSLDGMLAEIDPATYGANHTSPGESGGSGGGKKKKKGVSGGSKQRKQDGASSDNKKMSSKASSDDHGGSPGGSGAHGRQNNRSLPFGSATSRGGLFDGQGDSYGEGSDAYYEYSSYDDSPWNRGRGNENLAFGSTTLRKGNFDDNGDAFDVAFTEGAYSSFGNHAGGGGFGHAPSQSRLQAGQEGPNGPDPSGTRPSALGKLGRSTAALDKFGRTTGPRQSRIVPDQAAIKMQSNARCKQKSKQFRTARGAAIKLQSKTRCAQQLRRYKAAKAAAIRLQRAVRPAPDQKKFFGVKSATVKVQSVWRGYVARRRLAISINLVARWEARDQGKVPPPPLASSRVGRRPAPHLRSVASSLDIFALTRSEPYLPMPVAHPQLKPLPHRENRLVPMSASAPSLEKLDMLARMSRVSDPNKLSRRPVKPLDATRYRRTRAARDHVGGLQHPLPDPLMSNWTILFSGCRLPPVKAPASEASRPVPHAPHAFAIAVS